VSFNAAAVDALFAALVTDAEVTGLFEVVNTHEPKSAPQNGLNCSIWADTIKPVKAGGLNQTSGLVSFFVRIYNSMLAEPQDDIDPAILAAAGVLMNTYSGDFQLATAAGVDVRMVDLLGAYSDGLSAQAGYMSIDSKMFRVMVISLPVVLNDMFPQSP
jgi:hypothetical protein